MEACRQLKFHQENSKICAPLEPTIEPKYPCDIEVRAKWAVRLSHLALRIIGSFDREREVVSWSSSSGHT